MLRLADLGVVEVLLAAGAALVFTPAAVGSEDEDVWKHFSVSRIYVLVMKTFLTVQSSNPVFNLFLFVFFFKHCHHFLNHILFTSKSDKMFCYDFD